MSFDVNSYLDRISYSGSHDPTEETLRRLHRAHMQTVPFENLDIHLRRSIQLDPDRFFNKIVNEKRGGFCYELNGLFTELLRALGYSVKMLSARVANASGGFGREFDHMTLLVKLQERWIADVGFGDSFLEPLLLEKQDGEIQDGRGYRIVPSTDSNFLYQALGNDWLNQYAFQLVPYDLKDFNGMCLYHQTSAESTFTQKVVCSRATDRGRITLTDKKLIVSSGGQREETAVSSKDEFYALLQQHFGISINL